MVDAVSVQERDRLIANGLAHKVRNSLNTMRAHIALVQKFASLSAEERIPRQLTKLEDAVVGLEEIVKEFLAFASPARDEWEEVDLGTLLRDVFDTTAGDLERAGIDAVVELGPRCPKVLVDRGKLRHALLQLADNAIRAMPDGGRLAVRTRLLKGGHLACEVSDTGVGIAPGDQPRVFQPFFSGRPGGLGLGLAVVKRTIDDARGRITFQSKAGEGTTFYIILPPAARRRATLERRQSNGEARKAVVGRP
jgi:signal transduction histidine kinase